MNRIEQLNAVTRFSIYLFVIFILLDRNKEWLYVPIMCILATIVLYNLPGKAEKQQSENFIECKPNKKQSNVETGYYDYDGNLVFDSSCDNNWDKKSIKRIRPSKDNPFMNSSICDMNTNAPMASNVNDGDVKNEISEMFNIDSYRDMEDIFNRNNGERQFFTTHHTVPNDQEGFARWCYGFSPTCKTNQEQCMNYQDLRVPTSQLS